MRVCLGLLLLSKHNPTPDAADLSSLRRLRAAGVRGLLHKMHELTEKEPTSQ